MNKLEYAMEKIRNCDLCGGQGYNAWANGEDYDYESCDCNDYELIFDEDGDVIWDNGLLNEPELLVSGEAR